MGLATIGQIALTVTDVDRAIAFYRDVLGVKLLFQVPGMGFFDCDGVRLMLSGSEKADAIKTFALGYLVLVDEDIVGPSERWRHDEATAPIVEGRQDNRSCGLVFDTSKVRSFGDSGEDH